MQRLTEAISKSYSEDSTHVLSQTVSLDKQYSPTQFGEGTQVSAILDMLWFNRRKIVCRVLLHATNLPDC